MKVEKPFSLYQWFYWANCFQKQLSSPMSKPAPTMWISWKLVRNCNLYRAFLYIICVTLNKKTWLSISHILLTKYWSHKMLYSVTGWFVSCDIFTVLCLLLPMVISFEFVPFCLQFSSGNFGETCVANWEMFRFAFCKPDPSWSTVINSVSFLKKKRFCLLNFVC